MNPLDARRVRRRFLLLRALRWLPTGLLVPVLVLLLLERGFSLGEIGLVTAAQGLLVLLLELPTGGLADAIGRRGVLLVGVTVEIASVGLLLFADTLAMLLAVFALQGIYRALESGPLDSWYVDAAQDAAPDADIERGLSLGGVVLGGAVSAGALASGGLVALGPVAGIEALLLPLLASLMLEIVHLAAIAGFMTESRPKRGAAALRRSVAQAPATVAAALRLLRTSTALLALVSVELLWGFGMVTFESFTPAKLKSLLGDAADAAVLFGPASAAAWLISAAGAAMVPVLTRRVRTVHVAAGMRIAQGATVIGIALAVGPIGAVVAYLLTMWIHGAANPVHQGLLHRCVDGPTHRATVVSANSMTAHLGGALGGIALGALADAASLDTAILTGAGVLAAAAPLYLLVRLPHRAMSGNPSRTITDPYAHEYDARS